MSDDRRITRAQWRAMEQKNLRKDDADKVSSCSSRLSTDVRGDDDGRASSVVSGISATSSVRRARINRVLERLEEERRLAEQLSQERIAKEKELHEREMQEKLEREKQFIARKHELLRQQDVDEAKSVRSLRSSRGSSKRTADWVNQTKTSENSGGAVGGQTAASKSADANLSNNASDMPQNVQGSSTPIDGKGLEVESIPATIASLTIGEESEDSLDDVQDLDIFEPDKPKTTPVIPFVDIKPFTY